jgi:hypothetical protein
MHFDWALIWAFVWPILKQALIAFLVALLALLGYDGMILPQRLREFGLGGARRPVRNRGGGTEAKHG